MKMNDDYPWWEFWRDFYDFYEWMTLTLVLNRPKLISTDDEYKNTSRCLPYVYPTIFRKHVFNLITLKGCLTKKMLFSISFSLTELGYSSFQSSI